MTDIDWTLFTFFSIYAVIGIGLLILWWAIYGLVLTRGYDLRDALFGRAPNPAVALDLMGGFLAAAVLLYSIIAFAPHSNFRLDIPAVTLNVVVVVVLLAVLRLLVAGFLRLWFRQHRDAQGDIITINNELFKQRNMATGIFSTVTYLILVGGMAEWNFFNQDGLFWISVWNMLGIWLLGLVLIAIHSFFFLEYGTRNHILHEAFHDNNPAAPFSLMGLIAGMLPLNHYFLTKKMAEAVDTDPVPHMFNSPDLWMTLGLVVLFVLVTRGVLQVLIWAVTRINLRRELVVRDNAAWGLLDGGLVLALSLIFFSLMRDMEWESAGFIAIYAVIGLVSFILWWIIYDVVLTRGYDLKGAVFGFRPNAAVGMDLMGGLLAVAFLLFFIIALSPNQDFKFDIPAVVANMLIVLVLLALLRLVIAGFLRIWFRGHIDAQGDVITMNNELFEQRNMATGIFSTVTYIILVGGMAELDLFAIGGEGMVMVWNMIGIWVLGLVLIVLHSFFFLEYGTRNHILHESFHDNNPAAPFSLMGLVLGMLPLNHNFLITLSPGENGHMFNSPEHWVNLILILVFVLVARGVLQILLLVTLGINLRHELVVRDNVAWGLVDGGLLFALVLIFISLMS